MTAVFPTTTIAQPVDQGDDPTDAPSSVPELTTDGVLSMLFICFFVTLNISGTASSIAALCITAQLFYWGGIITEKQLWEGFGNGGVINLASLAVLVAALGNVPLVKKVAIYSFGGTKENRHLQLAKILAVNFVIGLFLPNANHAMLITPLLRNACLETGMNVQYALMPMCIVANIANGFAISSNSNIIVNGLWRAKFGYEPNFFLYAPSNFPAAILTTAFLVFITPFFYNPEMESSEGGANTNNNVEKSSLAQNPLNEKYSVLFQVFDTRNLQDVNKKDDDDDDANNKNKNNTTTPASATNNNNNNNESTSHLGDVPQCIIGFKEADALSFVPPDLISRLQLKWIDRSIFDWRDGGNNNDILSEDETSHQHDDAATEVERREMGKLDENNNNTKNKHGSPVKQPMPAVPRFPDQPPPMSPRNAASIAPTANRSKPVAADDSDAGGAREFTRSTSTPSRAHVRSDELDPTSKEHEKGCAVTITTTTTTRVVNGKTVVVKEQKSEEAHDRVIDKDDIVSVRGTIKDLRTFRALLGLAWVGVADIGRSRIVFQQQATLRKAEAEKKRYDQRLKLHVEGNLAASQSMNNFTVTNTASVSNNNNNNNNTYFNNNYKAPLAEPVQRSSSSGNNITSPESNAAKRGSFNKPPLPMPLRAELATKNSSHNSIDDTTNQSFANNDSIVEMSSKNHLDSNINHNKPQHERTVSSSASRHARTHSQSLGRFNSRQELADGEINLPAHPLTSEALASIAQDPSALDRILDEQHLTDDDIDQLSDDVIGQFKESSICYLRHASGARYNVKACALYRGLDAFQPASTESVANTHIFVAVASNDNPALGQRLESRVFVEQFGCAVLVCRPFGSSVNLLGRELAWHRLEPGDTVVVRVRPKSAYLWTSAKAKRAFFDIIAQPGSSMLTAAEKDKLLRNYVEIPPIVAHYFEIGQRSVTMRGRVVTLVRLPSWYFDWVPIFVFFFFVITTMAGASVPIIALLTIPLLVWSQIITVHEALQTADWKLYSAIAFAYAIGEGIASSGLARWIGFKAAGTGVKGFTAVLMAQFITGVVSCIVGNQGTPTVLFPIAMRMMRTLEIPEIVGLVVVSSGSVQGFCTTFGLPSNLIIATPGNYQPIDFLKYGTPVFIFYGVTSAIFTTLQFGLGFS